MGTYLDLRLFMTLVRFDPVYITYFKTNQARIVDYPNLLGFTRDVYSMEPVKKTINMDHIKVHYFSSHPSSIHMELFLFTMDQILRFRMVETNFRKKERSKNIRIVFQDVWFRILYFCY